MQMPVAIFAINPAVPVVPRDDGRAGGADAQHMDRARPKRVDGAPRRVLVYPILQAAAGSGSGG